MQDLRDKEDLKQKFAIYRIPFSKLLPNMITLLGLVVGVSSIRFALDSKWEVAIYCIIAAALIDGIDGRVARMLNASSEFGAELDSLCDFVNFGVSPALIIYLWSFQQYEYRVLSWVSMMIYVSCMAIRLARFNISVSSVAENDSKKLGNSFFVGVPAPSGAILCLIPIMLDFEVATLLDVNIRNQTILINIYTMFIAFLLASKIPTFSIKNLQIDEQYLSLSMIVFAVVVTIALVYPWIVLPIVSIIYFLSIIITAKIFNIKKTRNIN